MDILVIGSGGREHSLCWAISKSTECNNLYCAPGNAGIENIAECVNISDNDVTGIVTFAKENRIDLVVIGPEVPLVLGLVDALEAENIKAFGPNAMAAKLEGSKAFMKDLFKKYNIPTADYRCFRDFNKALTYINKQNMPIVIKASGLAAGKGVIICQNKKEAIKALNSIFNDKAFGSAGNKVVIEDFLEGEEASFIAVVSKDKIIPLATSQDHKAVGDGDVGLNTGGMGAYSPAPIVSDEIHQKILEQVMQPTMKGLIEEGSPYLGFLYAGLMIKNNEIKVLEFNCRFGDPETQPILLRLKSSLVNLCLAAINNTLDSYDIEWTQEHSCGVVIASKGYPENYESNKEIQININDENDTKLFHAGTKYENNKILTSGGRVFCATALGVDLKEAQQNAYNLVNKVDFQGAFFRKDIGYKGIK